MNRKVFESRGKGGNTGKGKEETLARARRERENKRGCKWDCVGAIREPPASQPPLFFLNSTIRGCGRKQLSGCQETGVKITALRTATTKGTTIRTLRTPGRPQKRLVVRKSDSFTLAKQ